MRELEADERAVLAHVVVNPDEWWTHVNGKDGKDGKRAINAKAALAAKVSRVKPDYDDKLGAENRRLEAIADGEKASSESVIEDDELGLNYLEGKRLSRIAAGEAATRTAAIVYQTRAEREETEVAALLPED